MSSHKTSKSPPEMSSEAANLVTQKLRDYYRSVEEEVIPDRFLNLLEQLEAAEKKQAEAAKLNETQNTGAK